MTFPENLGHKKNGGVHRLFYLREYAIYLASQAIICKKNYFWVVFFNDLQIKDNFTIYLILSG